MTPLTERYLSLAVAASEEESPTEVSAVMRRDEKFSAYNRISILGRRDSADGIVNLGAVTFSTLADEDERFAGFSLVGEGFVTQSIDRYWAAGVTNSTIYALGTIEIRSYLERSPVDQTRKVPEVSWLFFWPPPDGWPQRLLLRYSTGRVSHMGTQERTRWRSPRNCPFRFRLSVDYRHSADDRTGLGEDRYWLPAVAIQARNGQSMESPVEDGLVREAWHRLKMLLSFFYRCDFNLVERHDHRSAYCEARYWPQRLVRRERQTGGVRLIGRVEDFCSTGLSTIAGKNLDPRTLHAAVFSYVEAASEDLSWEGRLTSYVEGVERLLHAYEVSTGQDQGLLTKVEQRKASKVMRDAVDQLPWLKKETEAARELRKRVGQAAGQPLRLRLEDRVRRAVDQLTDEKDMIDRRLDALLGEMITSRNAIVHGRGLDDFPLMYKSMLTARVTFERLFGLILGYEHVLSDDDVLGQFLLDDHKVTTHRAF